MLQTAGMSQWQGKEGNIQSNLNNDKPFRVLVRKEYNIQLPARMWTLPLKQSPFTVPLETLVHYDSPQYTPTCSDRPFSSIRANPYQNAYQNDSKHQWPPKIHLP